MTKTQRKRPVTKRVAEEVAWKYRIDFETSAYLASQDADDPITTIRGTIIHAPDGLAETEVGDLRGWCVRWGRVTNAYFDFFEACDTNCQELCDIASLVWDSAEEQFHGDLTEGLGDLIVPEICCLSPEHRGKGIGLLAVWRFIDYFGSAAALAVLKPFPMDHSLDDDLEEGRAKLAKHWGRLGFRQLRDSEYAFLDLTRSRPSLEDLIDKRS